MKLKVKLLFFFILISTIPLLINNIIWFNASQNEIVNTLSTQVTTINTKASGNIRSFFTKKLIELQAQTRTQAMIKKNISTLSVELSNFLTQDLAIQQLQLIDASGQEILRVTRKKTSSELKDLTDQTDNPAYKIFTTGITTRYIGPVYLDKSNNPSVDIGLPIVASNSSQKASPINPLSEKPQVAPYYSTGVLIAKVHLKSLWQQTNALKIATHGYVFIVDDKGNLLNHPNATTLLQRRNMQGVPAVNEYLNTLTQDSKLIGAVKQTQNDAGTLALTSYQRITLTNWGAIAQVPLTDTLVATQRVILFVVILFFIALAFVILLSMELSKQILKPIQELQKGSRYIGSGNLAYRLQITSGDEIEELGNSFNAMAKHLQDAFDHLEQDSNIIGSERNKMAITLESVADAIIAVDTTQTIIVFNKNAQKLTEYTPTEAIGKPIDSVLNLSFAHERVNSTLYCPVTTNESEGIVFSKKNFTLTSKTGKEYIVDVIAGHIKEGLKTNVGCILTLHDVTQEQGLEEMKQDFVSIAAHELRTPLTSLNGYLAVFMEENGKSFSSEQNMFLKRIDMAVKQLMALVENLLNVSRIERGVLTVSIASLDWLSYTKQVINDFSDRAREKQLQLTLVEPARPLPLVLADKLRIGEVLSNILANAIAYTPTRGAILVSFEITATEVITHIQDTGMGIPPTALPKLFTKFFRVDAKLGQGAKGTGLGLYISKAIITMHKGKIWAQSEVGRGSTFSFSLPIAPQEEKASPQ